MGTLKLIILLCCTSVCLASHDGHSIIPVEGYETELQDLGEQVITPEAPVKIIKITKTIAVKVPVPYPVKVIQKVPYPVHISKPYPVPVPQIVKVPQPATPKGHHEQQHHHPLDSGHQSEGNSYDVHENHDGPNQREHEPSEHESFGGDHGNYENAHFGNEYASEGIPSQSYGAPNSYYGSRDGHDDSNSFESRSYDEGIKKYLDQHPQNHNGGSAGHY